MHPRQSILSMFDPLNQSTMQSLGDDSEKENATPIRAQKPADGLTMTAFFNRTYKPTLQPMQPTLTRRLVDVGDVTVDEFSIMALGLEELSEESEEDVDCGDDEGDTTVLAPHDLPPLVDEPTAEEPVTPKAVRSHIRGFSALTHQERTPPALIPTDFTDYGALPDHSEDQAPSLALPTSETPSDHLTISIPDSKSSPPSPESSFNPVITISSPVAASPSHSSPTAVTGKKEDSPVILPSSPSLTLRPRKSTDIAIDDPRRCSVDLQQSFCLQMQEADSSFDLLNDKISFFASAGGPGMETSFDDDDDSFDVKVKALGRSQEVSKDTTKGTDTLNSLDDIQMPTSDETQAFSLVETPISTPQLSPKNAPLSTAKSLDDANDNTELMKEAFHSRKPPINSSATPKPTTLSMAPPPVHALKIVKRSRLQQPTQARPRSSNLPEEINAIRPSSSRPILPLPDATKDSSSSSRPARVPSQAPRFKPPRPPVPKLVQGTSASSTVPALSGAPGRPTISQGSSGATIGVVRTTRAVTSPALPPTTTGPPARRVPLGIPDTKTPSVSANSPAAVLKPSRIPGKVSGLPRIASAPSRLPGPSATSRGRSTGDIGNATTRLVRPVPGRRIN